jgi:ABC-type multidrug transport system fused ATPase/permease subunit
MTKIRTGGSEAAQKAYAGAGDVAQQCLSSIRTVHAFGGQEREKHRYQEKLIAAEKVGLRSQLFNGVGLGSLQLVIFGVYALAFWYGNKLVPGTLNAGGVLNVLFAILIGSFSLGSAGPQISSIATAMGAAKIIFEIIDRKSLIDSLSDEGLKPEKVVGNIEFKNINFQYPSRPDVVILDNFNLNIESGKTVALVGTSGSGKSTIVKLFERFYDPASGTVTLDGVDIKLLNVNWLRRQVGMVSQEPVLFDATIRQNILYGIQNFSELSVKDQDARIEDACRQSNCWDFIQLLPKKLETSVGESGGMLSGGQKQRIAIARSIIKNPQVLLLDEATSALDTESERIVQAALEVASKNRTTIVIAHRLSTIKNADKIVVMEKGVIKEAGTHKELIDMGAIYADLVATQSLKGNMEEKIETKKEENDVVALKKNDIDGKEKEIEDKAAIAKVDALKLDYNRLMSWSKPEIGIYILASFGAILNGSVQPLFSILFATILTKLGTTESDTYPLLLACLGVGAFLSNFMQNLYVLAGEKVTRRLRYASFVAILSQDIEFFDQEENATGVLMSKLAEDASLVPGLTGQTFGAIIQGLGGVIGGLIIAFISCWQLALVILGMVPIIMLAGYLQFQNMTGVGTKTKKAYELISQQAAEAISSIRTIMTITQEKHFVAHFNKTVAVPYSSAIKSAPITVNFIY